MAAVRPGHALPGSFHLDASVYEYELEAIWRQSWLLAGSSAQAPGPGDFFRFSLAPHDLVVVRDEQGRLHALHNTCRHRGMPVCDEPMGTAKRWVCPYHQWSYGLDGRLLGCGGMEDALDDGWPGLRRAAVREVGGLVFVWLGGGEPDRFEAAGEELGRALRVQGIDRARVAHRIDYDVAANWKLVWQNNRECWHCHAGHPEYIRANFDAAPDTERYRELAHRRAGEHARALGAAAGLAVDQHSRPGLYEFPTPGRWWSANRTPLAPGFVSESLDGRPVAPLMGGYTAYDVGTLRIRAVPSGWLHASADHAVLTLLAPAGPERTAICVQWLVDRDAREGVDYELDRLLPFWRLTSEQDWSLCERNQLGVRNPAFTPGPYSPAREANVIAFDRWYLEMMHGA